MPENNARDMKRALRRNQKKRKRGRRGSSAFGQRELDSGTSGFKPPPRSKRRNLSDDLYDDILEDDDDLYYDILEEEEPLEESPPDG